LVLFTHRKSHTGFPLVSLPKVVTLNDLTSNSIMAIILRYFTAFGSLRANLRHYN